MQNRKENESNIMKKNQEELELEEILREIEADEGLKDVTVPETVAQGLYDKIAAIEAAVEEIETEEETWEQDLEPQADEENVVTYRRKKRSKKLIIMVAAIIVLVMGSSMVGVGMSYKWLDIWGNRLSKDVTIVVDSESDLMKNMELDEKEAYDYVKEVFGSTVVSLAMVDDELQYRSIEAYGELGFTLFYNKEEVTILYNIIQNKNKISHFEVQTGQLEEEYTIDNSGTIITVQKYVEEDGSTILKGSFTYNNLYYSLTGSLEKEEFEEILNNLYFFAN